MLLRILLILALIFVVGTQLNLNNDSTNIPPGAHEVVLAPDSPWTEAANGAPVFVQLPASESQSNH